MSRTYLVALLSGLLASQALLAERLDSASQKLLIDKLDKVYLHLAPNDPSKVAVTLRLADLYAERARQTVMSGNADSTPDREKALRLYNEVLDRAPEMARPKIVMQIGHLHLMNGQEDKAISFYKKNLGTQADPALLAEAHLSLGEIFFKRRQYPQAIQHYNEVSKNSRSGSRGLAAYRRAWSYFHQGQLRSAIQEIETILKSPELQSRSSSSTQVDAQFREEVARDLATFMAKEPLNQERLQSLFDLSPESTRISNVQSLAFELERLGRKDEALLTWTFTSAFLSSPGDRVAAHLSMAQLHLDKLVKDQALRDYEIALQSWKESGLEGASNEPELRRRARNFTVAWNQTEKKAPTAELLTAYDLYLGVFPADIDVQLYAAQVALELKNHQAAWKHYVSARDQLLKDAKATNKLEGVLLSLVELGEASKDDDLAQASYDSYIQHSPTKTKLNEVRYQKARALYDKADYAQASEALRVIALQAGTDFKIRKQAADLSLDALVLMKDEARLLTWAKEYEGVFKHNAADFSKIVQKTVLTKSANLAETDPALALAALKDFDAAKATPEDKIKYHKNTLLLAEKQGQIKVAAAAADALLSLPGVSEEDRELAWSRKAYFAELRLDFSTAFAATQKLQKTFPVDEKNFKLAVFAELSGRASSPFYLTYLSHTKDEDRKRLVAAELVRKAKNPAVEIESVKKVLAASPDLLAQLYAEIYARKEQPAILAKVTKDSRLSTTDAGRLLVRQAFLKEFAGIKTKLITDQMNTSSSGKLAQSIQRRAGFLQKAEELANRSIQNGDWTAQLVSIDLIARESERFYQDLLSAPVPQGLTGEEEQEYLTLLSNQAMPYQNKAVEAKAKVAQFWTSTDWSKPLALSWQQKPIRPLIAIEIAALQEIAPEEQKAKFASFTQEAVVAERPSLNDLQSARMKVFENPMDRSALQNLLELEKKSDNMAMSEYLATRLQRLDKGNL